MVLIPYKNLIINSDNICYAKIISEEGKGFTNKMSISLVGGEKLDMEFSSVETCKTFLNQIASVIHGCMVNITDNGNEPSLLYRGVQVVK